MSYYHNLNQLKYQDLHHHHQHHHHRHRYQEEKYSYRPNTDTPQKLQDVEWIIITKDNANEIFERIKAAGGEYALFAVEDTGYEKLQINYTDIRNKLAEQRQLLLAYREYYEPVVKSE